MPRPARCPAAPGRRSARAQDVSTGSPSEPYGEPRAYGGRAEARRAAQRGGRRRARDGAGGSGGHGGGRRGAAGGHDGGGRGGRPPGRKRLIDYPRHDKYGWRRWVPSWKLVTGLLLALTGSLMGAATVAYSMVVVPNPDEAATAQNNVYYWSDGTQMAATGGEVNRQIVGMGSIPRDMRYAVISAEDKTFEKNSGIDPMGIARAFFNMARGQQTQGGSTVTQQYVKNNRLNDQAQTLDRKFKELFISIKVNNQLTKDEIMAGYLNTAYYGRGAYGIQAAARTYYGKDAKDLQTSECAFLTSLLKGSTLFDPARRHRAQPVRHPGGQPEAGHGAVEVDPRRDGRGRPPRPGEARRDHRLPDAGPPKKQAQLSGQVGYLVDLAKAYFVNNNDQGITADDLSQGGYEIHTTFDKKKVKAMEDSVKAVYDKHIDPVKRPKYDTHVQFGGATVDVETGAILAIYGGTDATKHFTNNADTTGAQVGSDVQAVRAGRRHARRRPRPRQGTRPGTGHPHPGRPGQGGLQRRQQAHDPELRPHGLARRGRQGVAPGQRRRRRLR